MPEYFALFNAVTDAITQLEKAVAALKQAQISAEEAYIRGGSNSPRPYSAYTLSISAHSSVYCSSVMRPTA